MRRTAWWWCVLLGCVSFEDLGRERRLAACAAEGRACTDAGFVLSEGDGGGSGDAGAADSGEVDSGRPDDGGTGDAGTDDAGSDDAGLHDSYDGGIGPLPPGGLVGGESVALRIARLRRLDEEFVDFAVAADRLFLLVHDGGGLVLQGGTTALPLAGTPFRSIDLKGAGAHLALSATALSQPYPTDVTVLEVVEGAPRVVRSRTFARFASSTGSVALSPAGDVHYAAEAADGGIRVESLLLDGGTAVSQADCRASVFAAEATPLGVVVFAYRAQRDTCLGSMTEGGRVLLFSPDGGASRIVLSGFSSNGAMAPAPAGVFVAAPLDDGGLGTAVVQATVASGFTPGPLFRGPVLPGHRATGIAGVASTPAGLWVLDNFAERPGLYETSPLPTFGGSAGPASARVTLLRSSAALTLVDSFVFGRGQVSLDGFALVGLADAGVAAAIVVGACPVGSPSVFCRPDGGEGTWLVELSR